MTPKPEKKEPAEASPKQAEIYKVTTTAKDSIKSVERPRFIGTKTCSVQDQESNFARLVVHAQSKNMSQSNINAWIELTRRESNFCHTAQNPTSTAYGLGQFLDRTWAGYGYTKTSDPDTQIRAKYDYVIKRYGSPLNALQFHNKNNWY